MSPARQLQRLLAEVPTYEAKDLIALLPLCAALQSALYARFHALQGQAAMPDTDYLLNLHQIAERLGKSSKWVRDHIALFRFAFPVGQELRFSARGFEEWIAEQRAADAD